MGTSKHVFYADDKATFSETHGATPMAPERYRYVTKTKADDVFRVMNVVTGDPELEPPLTLRCRSMCVGDLYLEREAAPPHAPHVYICAAAGWTEVTDPAFVEALQCAVDEAVTSAKKAAAR